MDVIKFSKEDIEKILERKLLVWEYEFMTKLIMAKRQNKKVIVPFMRGSISEKALYNGILPEAAMLDGKLPENATFDEFIGKFEK